MSLGASPLTAYFSPASSSSSTKRKEAPAAPTRKSKTPRNDDSLVKSNGPRPGNATAKRQQELKQRQLPFIPEASLDPSTPSVGNRHEYTALQTPPASVEVGSRTKNKHSAKTLRSASPLQSNVTTEGASYLPTPSTSTRPRPKTRATMNSLPLAVETPCKSAALSPLNATRPSLPLRNTSPAILSSNPLNVVPSSQSQPDLEIIEAPPDKNPPWGVTRYPEVPEEEGSDLSKFVDYPHADEAGMTVASSQSQFLLPFKLSPQKKRRDRTSLVISTRQVEIDDIIPSSQSYEKELQIPEVAADPLPVDIKKPTPHQSGPSAWAFDQSNVPARTLSDEMFSVPISSSSILDKLLEEEGEHDEILARNPPGAPPTVQGDNIDQGSATETDTDEDWPYPRPLPAPVQNLRPDPENQEGAEEVPNDPPDDPTSQLQSQVSSTEYAADCSQIVDDSPSSSLPSVLQEFRDMFGSGDDSYPPDFPMSLRF